MELRPFRPEDAATILTWIDDERTLFRWAGPTYDHFPIAPQDMLEHYAASGPDFWPLTAMEDGRIVGHLILRRANLENPSEIRLGDIIVDNARRGQHLGSRMIRAAMAYARDQLGAASAALGVYLNNPAALRCYLAVGFALVGEPKTYTMMGEPWPFQNMACPIPC